MPYDRMTFGNVLIKNTFASKTISFFDSGICALKKATILLKSAEIKNIAIMVIIVCINNVGIIEITFAREDKIPLEK